jgi:photosystem II stability/assembly factor-like uncharacterized protein
VLFGQGSWERIEVATNHDLNSLYFTDSLYGWVAGDSGTMLHTEDGGNTWTFQESQTFNNIRHVFFLDRNLGWGTAFDFTEVPYGTELLRTTNGGKSWSVTDYPEDNLFMNCIFFLDSLNGWMGGSPHALVKSTDGGVTWSQADVDTSTLAFFPVLNIRFYNEQYGYASGGIFDIAGVTWHTSNGGEKWYAIDPSEAPADEVHGLHLFDSITVIGSGGDPDFGYGVGMLFTENGGINWNYEELGIQGIAYDIDFRNTTEAWSPLGNRKKLMYSTDGGVNWEEKDTPESTAIYDIQFTDSLHGFASGREGAVLRYIPPMPVSITDKPSQHADEILLHQNVPNPFRNRTTISFEIMDTPVTRMAASIRIELSVFNTSGEKVLVLTDKSFGQGKHRVTMIEPNLPKGRFYLILKGWLPDGEVILLSQSLVRI